VTGTGLSTGAPGAVNPSLGVSSPSTRGETRLTGCARVGGGRPRVIRSRSVPRRSPQTFARPARGRCRGSYAAVILLAMIFQANSLGAQARALITPGMTESEVRALIGAPARVLALGESLYLFYPECERGCDPGDFLILREGRVIDAVVGSALPRFDFRGAEPFPPSSGQTASPPIDPLGTASPLPAEPHLLPATPFADGPAPGRAGEIRRITGPRPQIDGRLDDDAWRAVDPLTDFVQSRPRAGLPATEPTEALVLHDDEAIYVAFRLLDSRPDSIVARLARRDSNVYSDRITVQLDSNRDGRTAFSFSVNPRGIRSDELLFGDTRRDPEWNAVWDAAAQVDSLGWTAEFRIPFSQLRYTRDAEGRPEVWGINLVRHIARLDETSAWAITPPTAGRVVSLFGVLDGFGTLPPARGLEFLPYSVVALTRAPADAGNPFYRANEAFGSAGADLKFRLTSNFTVAAAINPDFGQIEADPAELNLTAFETHLPEKRPFFLEGREIFAFDADGVELFYSRRIGRAPQGNVTAKDGFVSIPDATTILGATKLSGRSSGGWSVGLLHALTGPESARIADSRGVESTSPVEPLTSYSVLRISRDLLGGDASLGGTLTSTNRRLGEGGELDFLRSSAVGGGVNGRLRRGEFLLNGALLGSLIQGSSDAIDRAQRSSIRYFQRPGADHIVYDPARTRLSGYAARLSFGKVGGLWKWTSTTSALSPGFDVNDLGFQRRADLISQWLHLGYDRYTPRGAFRSWGVSTNSFWRWSFGREPERRDLGLDGYLQLLDYSSASFGVTRSLPALSTDALRGGPALFVPGRTSAWFSWSGDPRQPLSLHLFGSGSVQDQSGGGDLGGRASIVIRPSPAAEISVGPYLSRTTNRAQFVGERSLRGHPRFIVARLDNPSVGLAARIDYTFSPVASLEWYLAPFVGAARYTEFKQVRQFRSLTFSDRFQTLPPAQVSYDDTEEAFMIDADGDGTTDWLLSNPSFNAKSLDSNLVLRWEYRRGSTLFLVWSHGRWDYVQEGSLQLRRDLGRLLEPATEAEVSAKNVLMLKMTYWVGR